MNAPIAPAPARELQALEQVLTDMAEVAVAVSGGVDSLTLATCAQRVLAHKSTMFHAVSPAVPEQATRRARELAEREGWRLHIIDAGEFDSADYLRNPLNRCFYCKSSLYGAIRPHTGMQIVSGTNLDDLGDYRPGLIAAKEFGVRHPFVEAGIGKRHVREIARHLGLGELAELPASPCLSSRVETGIAIDARTLAQINQAEQLVAEALQPRTVRCRVRAQSVVIELDTAALESLPTQRRDALSAQIAALFFSGDQPRPVRFAPYRLGSAFLHPLKLVP